MKAGQAPLTWIGNDPPQTDRSSFQASALRLIKENVRPKCVPRMVRVFILWFLPVHAQPDVYHFEFLNTPGSDRYCELAVSKLFHINLVFSLSISLYTLAL